MKKKKPVKRVKSPSSKATKFTISVTGGKAILKQVRGGFQLQVSPTSKDPQGGCVTCFPYPTEPYLQRGDFIVWCEQGTCGKECHVHETWDDDEGHHDEDRGAKTQKDPFHFKVDDKKKDRHFQCRCDETKG